MLARRPLLLSLLAVWVGANAQNAPGPEHPRYTEAVEFASKWRDLVDEGNDIESFRALTLTFQRNLTPASWREAIGTTRARLGSRLQRNLRRVVWYDNPANAPLPGLYAAIEFDSIYENASKHFQYVMLHSQGGAPFKVMRNEETFALDTKGGKAEK
jgi:hypothetical protein